jgi:hypothetical protein
MPTSRPVLQIAEIAVSDLLVIRWIAILLVSLCAGCETIEFDAAPEGFGQPIRVTNDRDIQITLQPLTYRMRADEGHLVLWIQNPTSFAVELVGDKSVVVDPNGDPHPLEDQTIFPGGSAKFVLPPIYEGPSQPPPTGPASAINPYDQPGFIAMPDQNQSQQVRDASWQWDDELEIELNLVFQRNGQQFQQHFSLRRVRK